MASELLPDPPQAVAEVWDRATFNDIESPGLVKVTISRGNKWDSKKAQGSHGGERTFKGADLASIKIQVRLWTADDYVAFNEQILSLLEPDAGKKKPTVINFGHAVAWSRNLRAFTVDNISGPESDPAGFVIYDIDATEHREPDKSNAQGKPGVGKGGNCQALAAQMAVLDSQQLVWESIRSAAAHPFTLDPAQLGRAEAELVRIDIEKSGVRNAQIVAGCINTSYMTGQDQEAAA